MLAKLGVVMPVSGVAPGTLEELRTVSSPVVALIVSLREAQTALTVGLQPGPGKPQQLHEIVESADEDGRVRAFHNTLSHCSGRIAVERPPLQMLTKRTLSGDTSARSVLRAAPGRTLVSADYSQLELRMVLALSEDRLLGRLVLAGEDPFLHLSRTLAQAGLQVDRDASKKVVCSPPARPRSSSSTPSSTAQGRAPSPRCSASTWSRLERFCSPSESSSQVGKPTRR